MQWFVLEQDIRGAVILGRQLVNFIWPEASAVQHCGKGWHTVLDDRAGIRIHAIGAYLEFEQAYKEMPVLISYCAEGAQIDVKCGPSVRIALPVSIETSQTTRTDYRVSALPTIAGGRIECSSRDPACRVAWKNLQDRDETIDLLGVSDATFPSTVPIDPIKQAYSAIEQYWPDEAEEIACITRVIVPMNSGETQRIAASFPSRNGAIFVDIDAPELLEEAIVHENAHIKLRYMQFFDPLIANTDDKALSFIVPWRPDPRPIGAIFEAVYVYIHVTEYAIRRTLSTGQSPSGRPARFWRWVAQGLAVLCAHARFTSLGEALLRELITWHLEQAYRCGLTDDTSIADLRAIWAAQAEHGL